MSIWLGILTSRALHENFVSVSLALWDKGTTAWDAAPQAADESVAIFSERSRLTHVLVGKRHESKVILRQRLPLATSEESKSCWESSWYERPSSLPCTCRITADRQSKALQSHAWYRRCGDRSRRGIILPAAAVAPRQSRRGTLDASISPVNCG